MPTTQNAKGQQRRVSEAALHGGVRMAGRVVFAEELTYIHVSVDDAGDHWARLFETNQNDNTATRAAITRPPTPQPSNIKLGVNIDALTPDAPVSVEELKELRELVQDWVEMREAVAEAAVVSIDDVDYNPPLGGSREGAIDGGSPEDRAGAGPSVAGASSGTGGLDVSGASEPSGAGGAAGAELRGQLAASGGVQRE